MPEECAAAGTDLEKVLASLEDYSLNGQNYQDLQNVLESVNHITAPLAEKLLTLYGPDRIDDLKYTAHIISSVLKKIKDGHCTSLPNLEPSAVAVLNLLKTTALIRAVEALKITCFETFINYPDDTLIDVVENHSDEIFEVINLYCHQSIPALIRVQPINIIGKLLKILPPDKKAVFVKGGIKLWFARVIPIFIEHMKTSNGVSTTVEPPNILECLELLTEELIQFDYSNNNDWRNIFDNIQSIKRYPSLVMSLLENGNTYWYRLWIIFIKLLKNQTTLCVNNATSPINALLPCVQVAFKMDISNRCRAFLCWNVLIDNFSKDINENIMKRRLKLLVMPLTSNIAKVEETALANFNTWWHLITRFQTNVDKFLEMFVIPFLHFCFGEPKANTLVPGKISEKTKVKCVQAFFNIIGHNNCDGCVDLPKLEVNLLHTTLLVSHWKDWMYSFSNAIKICVEHHEVFSDEQIKCAWKSFILIIAELPENNIRRDVYDEALNMLEGLTQDCDNRLTGTIVNVLIPTLFDEDDKIHALLKSKDDQNIPIYKILTLLNKLPLDKIEDGKTAIQSLKLLTNYLMTDAIKKSNTKIEWFLKHVSPDGLLLWTAMAESISCCNNVSCPRLLSQILRWPFRFMDNFVNREESTTAWINMYKTIMPHIKVKSINKDIHKALLTYGDNQSSCLFVLTASLVVLEQKLCQSDTDLNNDIKFILQLTSTMSEAHLLSILPSLSLIIAHVLRNLVKQQNITIAEHVIFIVNNILKICNSLFLQQPNIKSDIIQYIENIFSSLEYIFKLSVYTKLNLLLIDQLKELSPHIKHEKTLTDHIQTIYKISSNHHTEHTIAEVLQAYETSDKSRPLNDVLNKKEDKFSTPSIKESKKNKKDTDIISTVFENGEEFVVVKSNWKFNPKKLTDNQKEKFQRKREDIPALYQDLSQSQDEFRLTTWKTNSQDTSVTSSKSTSASVTEDISVILKNIPHSEVVPKIIENIITKSTVDATPVPGEGKINAKSDKFESSNKLNVPQAPANDTKLSRTTLKDRVFRNVRNLIEKSNLSHELKTSSGNDENILKTPLVTKVMSSVIQTNSVSPHIISERPPRLKRKPKKFDDLQMFSLKKKRYSIGANDSKANIEIIENHVQQVSDSLPSHKIDIENKKKSKVVDNHELSEAPVEKSSVTKDVGRETINVICPESTKILTETILTNNNSSLILEHTNTTYNNGIQTEARLVNEEVSEKPDVEQPINKVNKQFENTSYLSHNKNSTAPSAYIDDLKEIDDTALLKFKEVNITENNENSVISDTTNDENEVKSLIDETTNDDIVKTTETTNEKICPNNTIINTSSSEKIHKEVNKPCGLLECSNDAQIPIDSTPKDKLKHVQKMSRKKKSRIENQLAIDMVEGHPFLTVRSKKRLTRNTLVDTPFKRKNNETKNRNSASKVDKKTNNKVQSISIRDSQNTEDVVESQDFIESSQESNVTAMSVTSKPFGVKRPVVVLKQMKYNEARNLVESVPLSDLTKVDSNSDVELPCNETNVTNLTENKDTELVNVAIVLSDEEDVPAISASAAVSEAQDTQATACADTQSVDPDMFSNTNMTDKPADGEKITQQTNDNKFSESDKCVEIVVDNSELTSENITKTMSESALVNIEKDNASSPCCNEQRKKDFLDNTLEISPIKNMSPVRDQTSPTSETSNDYLVIKLTSPVQINGVPFESPEMFTEDNSPDKRDQSPPREEINVTNTSPSSSMTLKKNRPQVRCGGRAAQMLGLCVQDRQQPVIALEKTTDTEEPKKSPSLNTSARRNLRILYNSSNAENNVASDDSENSTSFLKLKRPLPTTDCSPSGPILKRKFADITDDTSVSPASKKKRVSFHDPPVSTTVCVKKYIEPLSIRSPQNSAFKRLERQLRALNTTKTPRKLENVFKLDSILNKAVESFSEVDNAQGNTAEIEISSLDETPVVEVIKTSDLNDCDPICMELMDCTDHISNIAEKLSSPAAKALLIEKLEGKVDTIGDLAKMTELEINRLCIKAPKVQVVKKVFNDYLCLLKETSEEITPTVEVAMTKSFAPVSRTNVEVQTDCKLIQNIEMQTDCVPVCIGSSQTDALLTSHVSVQTDESGSKSTADIITTCLEERSDFVERLCENMNESSKQKIVESVSFDTITMTMMKKLNTTNYKDALIGILNKIKSPKMNEDGHILSILKKHLVEGFEHKDLILFCSDLLRMVYDTPV